MYKKQMILQRIVSYALLIAAALVFIYSLGLMTDMYAMKLHMLGKNIENPEVAGAQIYYYMQEFNRSLTMVGIGLILLAVTQFIFQNHNRRKYYIGNYISVGANTVAAIAASVWALTEIFAYKKQFLTELDFEALKEVSLIIKGLYTESTFWFDLSVWVFGILLIVTLLNVINLIFKVFLMKSEKALLEGKGV